MMRELLSPQSRADMVVILSSSPSATSLGLNPKYVSIPHKTLTVISNSFPVIIKYPNSTPQSNNNSSFTTPTIFSSSSYCNSKFTTTSQTSTEISPLFTSGASKHWIVQMDKPPIGIITKSQAVDYYVQALTKVLGNEKDAQMCIYDVSWQFSSAFCCELDEECAKELAATPGVLSVQPDENFDSNNKDHGGESLQRFSNSPHGNPPTNIKTKKLFVTGLSFYTSEKTLRAAFEGFGELVEVRIIMDKISKRSKGYAFIEYTTEEAASAALAEMNGKIINGWMIVVDVAKTNPTKYSRGRPRPNI